MFRLFFELGNKFQFQGETYQAVTNKLDSHNYVMERKINQQNYLQNTYYLQPHENIITYYNCWVDKQIVVVEVPTTPMNIKKKNLTSILNKKVKGQSSHQNNHKTPLINQQPSITKQQQVLYIQLQSFYTPAYPKQYSESVQYMAIVYLLGQSVFKETNVWPRMIPVNTEEGKIKFLKKGTTLLHQLYNLFKYITSNVGYSHWPNNLIALIENTEIEKGRQAAGQILLNQIKNVINKEYSLTVYNGEEKVQQKCFLNEQGQLILKQLNQHIPLDQFTVSYSYSQEDSRQIILNHVFFQSIKIVGKRGNFIIKYLKQLKTL